MTYREELVQLIKESGQELIDRAEEMLPESLEYYVSFGITITFPSPGDLMVPVIEYRTEYANKHSHRKLTAPVS